MGNHPETNQVESGEILSGCHAAATVEIELSLFSLSSLAATLLTGLRCTEVMRFPWDSAALWALAPGLVSAPACGFPFFLRRAELRLPAGMQRGRTSRVQTEGLIDLHGLTCTGSVTFRCP